MVSLASTDRVADMRAPSVGGGGSLKRKHMEPSSPAAQLNSSQLKKRRVTFDPEVDVRVLSDENDKSLELVGEEVRRALEKHAAGERGAYDQVKAVFREDPKSEGAPSTGLLQKYVIALTNHVHLLDYKCKGLVHAVIDCPWAARNEHFVRSYRNLLRSLLSIQSGYTSTVLQVLVSMFLKVPSVHARRPDDPPIQRVRIQGRVHDTLRSVLKYSPMASSHLASVLTATFPFASDDAQTHVQYIRNILQVSNYCPEIKGEILSLITDKLAKIDAQMQVDIEDEDEEDLLSADPLLDQEDDEDSDDESVASEDSLDEAEQRRKDLKETVKKLDVIMDLLFSHYDETFAEDRFEADELFESLLSQFAATILPTYRSRHVQFLLFHFSQTSADRTERFAGACSHLAFDQSRPHIFRVTAAAYLGSFIARGAHVSADTVRAVFDLLCHHLEAQRIVHEPGCKGPDLRRYGTYYAICQALLYTFCFRWRELIITPDGRTPTDEDIIYHDGDFQWYASTREIIHRNILSRLNPLKICAPTIVAQFARMAHHLKFDYVYPLIETNKRIRLSRSMASGYLDGIGGRETALNNKKGEETFLLDAYFPFDPYWLPRSKRWLERDYVVWKPVPGMPVERDEDDEDDDDDEDDEEDDDDDDEVDSSSSSDEEEVDDIQVDDLDDGSTETSF